MERTQIAYALMGLMTLAMALLVAWRIYYGRVRVMDRQRARDLEAHRQTMAAKDAKNSGLS